MPQLVKEHSVSAIVCDFAPLRVPMGSVKDVSPEMHKLDMPLIQVRDSVMKGGTQAGYNKPL